jgi:hypothetical protein
MEWARKRRKKASPLSEPTVTDRREVMERGVETNVYHTLERYKNQGDEGR